ncbi:MAG: hypothetical protein WBV82_07820 [Myxococcaceae bacterium]
MSLLLVIFMTVVVVSRRKRGSTIVVPTVIGTLALVVSVRKAISLLEVYGPFVDLNPSDQATVLAAGISEWINGLAIEIPLLVAAYFLDRWLLRRGALRTQSSAPHAP